MAGSSLVEDVETLQQRLERCYRLIHQLSQELFQRLVPERMQQRTLEQALAAQAQELQRLKVRFHQYECLIGQLSGELYQRLRQERQVDATLVIALQSQIQALQTELHRCQQCLQQREQELVEMYGSLQAARERNQNLETILRDLPELYRRRFQARLAPVKEQLSRLQEENRRLQSELQRYGALVQGATKPQPTPSVDLPRFPPLQTVSRALS